MSQGDAFSRLEVKSKYVTTDSRYIVSLIVGFESDETSSPEMAAELVKHVICASNLTVFVFDRETGEFTEVLLRIGEFDGVLARSSES